MGPTGSSGATSCQCLWEERFTIREIHRCHTVGSRFQKHSGIRIVDRNLMIQPLVSIIIPAYNEEKYIQKSLESVKNQNYYNKEIIVVENACNNKTVGIDERVADKVIVTKTKGISNAKNLGVRASSGSIYLFLDADSSMELGLIQHIVARIRTVDGFLAGGKVRLAPLEQNLPGAKGLMILENAMSHVAKLSKRFPDGSGACVFISKELFGKIEKKHGEGWNTKKDRLVDVDFLRKIKTEGKYFFVTKKIVFISMRRFQKSGYWTSQLDDLSGKVRDWDSYK